MNKIVFIKENSPEVRNKLKKAGFTLCVCAFFDDSVWLDYNPERNCIHGEGCCVDYDLDNNYSPLERIKLRLSKNKYYPENREFFDNVDEFIKKYKVVSDQP